MRVLTTIKQDLQFQFRHGFYYAYLLICTLYIIFLRMVPLDARALITRVLIFSDPAILGFFFIGGIVLLEKGQNILENLFVTPLRIREYFIAKTISLTILAVIASLLIIIVTLGLSFNPFPLLLGIILGSIFFILLGIVLASRVKTVNGYLLSSPLLLTGYFLPLLKLLNIYDHPLFYLSPGKGVLILLDAAFVSYPIWQLVYAVLQLTIWIVIAYLWAHNWFYKYIILKIGGSK